MQPEPKRKEPSPYSKWERRGSALAHASALLLGVPLLFVLPPYIAFLLNPVVAYFIGKFFFRPRRLAWGTFQCIQASVVHLIIVVLLFIPALVIGIAPVLVGVLFTAAVVLFLYTLWGAWDTLLGYDFRYILIGNFLDRVSEANLRRHERRRNWLQSTRTQRDDPPRG